MIFKNIVQHNISSKVFNLKHLRNLSTKLKENHEDSEKKTKKRAKPAEFKLSKDIQEYYNTPEKQEVLRRFPEKLLRRKIKTPEHLYIANTNTAKLISSYLVQDIDKDKPFLEINPGLGFLTKEILERTENKIMLFEANESFTGKLKELVTENSERLTFKESDFLALWKLVFQDKLDNGGRVPELLWDIPKKEWEDDTNIRLFANVGSLGFIKHLINSFIFQNSLLSYGRCEIFMCLPPPLYIHLSSSNRAGYLMYRSTTILFQLLFEHEFITKLPRQDFLPWQSEFKLSPSLKLTKFNLIDPDYMYLVKIVPRKEFFQFCQPKNLQALWFFVKQNFVSRKNRVIPALERWIPNCGPRLIVARKPSESVRVLHPNLDPSQLPMYSELATTISNQNFFENMNIFTQFGDLSPSQVLSIFDEFINWPEYKQCPFIASMENSLLKLETTPDESPDNLDLQEVDDLEISETSKKL